MLCLLTAGCTLWLLYGLAIEEFPIIIANGVTLILLLFLTAMKVWFTRPA
jgi:MtN3 and saliva related transmembrane protein